MTTLDEALARVTAEWVLTNDEWKELEPIVAAARNWHTLNSDEAIERVVKALMQYEAQVGPSWTWASPRSHAYQQALAVVDALTDTAEEEK